MYAKVPNIGVGAAQESQRNRKITAWFPGFTPAWFFSGLQLTNNLVETINRSVVLKDCNFNFGIDLIEVKIIISDKLYSILCWSL